MLTMAYYAVETVHQDEATHSGFPLRWKVTRNDGVVLALAPTEESAHLVADALNFVEAERAALYEHERLIGEQV
jgi:hypothetical protein